DEANLGAERVAYESGERIRVGARAFAPDRERNLQGVREGLDLGLMPRDAKADLVGAAAEPGEFGGIILNAGRADQRLHCQPATEGSKRGPVLRRNVVKRISGIDAAGSGDVLNDECASSGEMVATA